MFLGKALAGGAKYIARYAGRRLASAAAGAATKYAGKVAMSAYRKYRRRGRSQTLARPITTQRDSAVTYVSNRQRSSTRRFARRVRDAMIADQPLQTYQTLRKARITSNAGENSYDSFEVLDVRGSNQSDLSNVFKDAFGGTGIAADYEDNRLYVRNAVSQLVLRNPGAEEVMIDLYELQTRRDVSQTTIKEVYVDAVNDMSAVGTVAPTFIGMTLFDCPEFGRNFKIAKRRSIKLKGGESVSVMMRTRLNRVIPGKRITTATLAIPGITRAWFMFMRGVPTNNVSAAGTPAATIDALHTTSITYSTPLSNSLVDTIGQSK